MPIVVDPVRLPPHIERGSAVGPEFMTAINTLATGVEDANIEWNRARINVDAAYGMMKDMQAGIDPDGEDAVMNFKSIMAFFNSRFGRARGFLFEDPTDHTANDQPLYPIPGDPDGRWQLAKTYGLYVRKITRPRAATLYLYSDGELVNPATYDLQTRGRILFSGTVPDQLTADFTFDVPMRFVNDKMMVNLEHIQAGSIPEVPLIEILE